MKFLIFVLTFAGILSGLSSNAFKVEPSEGEHWQGDIKLTAEQILILVGAARTANNYKRCCNTGLKLIKRWPKVGGYVWVPYTIDTGNFSKADKQLIQADLRTLEKKTCVRFMVRTNQVDYINIFNGTGCWSNLGRLGGVQQLSLQNPGCIWSGTIIHEFIHALGYTHMQNHIDRDDFVTINFENIDPPKKFNFDKVNSTIYGNFNTLYDYFSVMHYGRKAFSNNGNDTIVPTNSSFIDVIGQRKISPEDAARINNIYEC